MPNNSFASTLDSWKQLADIDYFGMYVKAYIPFNAWMNLNYRDLDSDRAKINVIKREDNVFKNKIVSLLQFDDQDSIAFRTSLGALHVALERASIVNQGNPLTFSGIWFKSKNKPVKDTSRYGVIYHAHYGSPGKPTETVLTLKRKAKGAKDKCFVFKDYEYDLRLVGVRLQEIANQSWRDELLNCYRGVAPLEKVTLLAKPESRKYILCGEFKFIDDSETLSQGIIEIFYNLRNTLFHGEVNPKGDAQKVYGAAYHLLRQVIEVL